MNKQAIFVKHNAEIAHRLSLTPGKCEHIHGHSLQIELTLYLGETDVTGKLGGMDFGEIKAEFRSKIDGWMDHHLLMNARDPLLAHPAMGEREALRQYPGLVTCGGDPTIENIAMWITEWATEFFKCDAFTRINETNTNGASCFGTGPVSQL